jgi:cytochrome c oxidase assembly protein subunit 11
MARTLTRTARTGLICAAVVVAMTGAAFAAVPLYRAFCQLTGLDGTTMRADAAPGQVLDRTINIRFDGNVRGLSWRFRPEQVSQTVRIGATSLAYYEATNTGSEPITGTSTFNVVPEAAGGYFSKLECFCFQEQTIQPGETVRFPVVYFVDPTIVGDAEARRIDEITLSYTFFPVKPAEPKAAAARSAVAAGRG